MLGVTFLWHSTHLSTLARTGAATNTAMIAAIQTRFMGTLPFSVLETPNYNDRP
jgi:hypothetical protein